MFTIRRDPVLPLIRVTMHDFWTVDTVDAYGAALVAEIGAVLARGTPVGLLIDCRDYPVQSAPVADRFAAAQATWPPPSPDGVFAIAIVTGSVLNKIQARRTFGPAVDIFLDLDDAATWLDHHPHARRAVG